MASTDGLLVFLTMKQIVIYPNSKDISELGQEWLIVFPRKFQGGFQFDELLEFLASKFISTSDCHEKLLFLGQGN